MGNLAQQSPQLPAAEQAKLKGKSELGRIPGMGNGPALDFDTDKSIQQIVEDQVERTPDAVAVVFKETQLSYRELNQLANQLAHHLRALGVGPEVRVGVCFERSVEMIFSLLAILKAGGVYVPLDPAFPESRLTFVIEETQPAVLLAQGRLVDRLTKQETQVVCVDAGGWAISKGSDSNPTSRARPENLAYIMFTSGSTGKPKGVMIPHAVLRNQLLRIQAICPLAPNDRILAATPFSFSGSLRELLWPLTTGASIVMPQSDGRQSARHLAQVICKSQTTCLNLVPSLLSALLEEAELKKCSTLRTVIVGAEPVPPQLVERTFERLGATVHIAYGLSEAPTATVLSPDPDSVYDGFAIGRPTANTQVYVLDSNWQPVPVDVPGELYIGGMGLGRGYLGHPDLTAERFVPSPFSDEPGERLYRTGDLAHYLPDGSLAFLRRIDNQVKIRGQRVEPIEIEARLRKHPKAQAAVVVARLAGTIGLSSRPATDRRLVAYVVPSQGSEPTATELRKFLQVTLPDHMIPSAFIMLDALPLTRNGKVDRSALPAPDWSRPNLEQAYVAPRTDLEQVLARIWTQVLGIKQVGVHDSFFELGGDSLTATRLVSRVRKTLNVELPLSSVFGEPVLADQAMILEEIMISKIEGLGEEES